jgi:hypothetical protein
MGGTHGIEQVETVQRIGTMMMMMGAETVMMINTGARVQTDGACRLGHLQIGSAQSGAHWMNTTMMMSAEAGRA